MNVVITIDNITDFGLQTNALLYNAIVLYELYDNAGVHNVKLHNTSDQNDGNFEFCNKIYYYDKLEALDTDVIIQVYNRYPTGLKNEILKINKDIKFVYIEYGNRFMIDICKMLYMDKPLTSEDYPLSLEDKVEKNTWISPHFLYTKDYFTTIYSTEPKVCPYIWDESLIKSKCELNDFKQDTSKPKKLTIGIFESNLLYGKTSIIPICIAEALNKNNKDIIDKVYVYNLSKFTYKITFNNFIVNTTLYKEDKLVLFNEPADIVKSVKLNKINTVISHQNQNTLNYLYLEMFYMNVALIHNSPIIKNFGFYYKDFDVIGGAKALKKVLKINTKLREPDYKNLFDKFSITNNNNIELYHELLENLE
jgi:hypothetical protein